MEEKILLKLEALEEAIKGNSYFDTESAAAYLKMPISTFRMHLQKNHIKGSRPGKSWIFSKADLDEFYLKFRVQ